MKHISLNGTSIKSFSFKDVSVDDKQEEVSDEDTEQYVTYMYCVGLKGMHVKWLIKGLWLSADV